MQLQIQSPITGQLLQAEHTQYSFQLVVHTLINIHLIPIASVPQQQFPVVTIFSYHICGIAWLDLIHLDLNITKKHNRWKWNIVCYFFAHEQTWMIANLWYDCVLAPKKKWRGWTKIFIYSSQKETQDYIVNFQKLAFLFEKSVLWFICHLVYTKLVLVGGRSQFTMGRFFSSIT